MLYEDGGHPDQSVVPVARSELRAACQEAPHHANPWPNYGTRQAGRKPDEIDTVALDPDTIKRLSMLAAYTKPTS
jgi:hypothetical protein